MKYNKIIFGTLILFVLILITACSNDEKKSEKESSVKSVRTTDPNTEKGKLLRKGEELMIYTNSKMPEHVGNKLACTSCHAQGGNGNALSLEGVSKKYPQYRDREGRDVSLKERINGCFARSMNGKTIKENSEEMKAMVAYLDFISEDIKKSETPEIEQAKNIPEPNVDKGKEAFDRNNCLSCHGNGSSSAPFTGPSLWGPDSFNTGAGMSRFSKMYDFIYHNMPFGEEGTLSKQEASDITAYILTQDRPEFVNKSKEKFYPKGGEPDDKISEKEREQILNHDYDWQELEEVSSK